MAGALSRPAFATNKSDQEMPSRPITFISDQGQCLDSQNLSVLQELLAEHERSTGEQIFIAILNNRINDLPIYARDLFLHWEIGRSSRGNGVLILADPENREGILQIGHGLEGLLGPEADRISREILSSGLKNGQVGEAVSETVVELLRALQSPLVSSLKTEALIQRLKTRRAADRDPSQSSHLWLLLLIFGVTSSAVAVFFAVSHEAHYTASGWFRPRPWQLLQLDFFKSKVPEDARLEGISDGW